VNDSLSIIVPLSNDEAVIQQRVHRLLELLPDLTPDFQIVLVDDGSTDHTPDIAGEIAREYPQVSLVCHRSAAGRDAAIKSGMTIARGRTIFILEDQADISATNLRRLWSLRHDPRTVIARTQRQPGVFDSALLDRLTTWGQAMRNLAGRASPGGVQMIRRDAAHALATLNSEIAAPANTAGCTTGPTGHP